MVDLKLSFDSETMLPLTHVQCKQLSVTGETVTDFAPAKDYWIDENFSRLFLCFDSSASDYFFQFTPAEDIDAFIKNAYLTSFFPKTGKIKLVENLQEPLHELLLKKRFEVTGLTTIEKPAFKKGQKIFTDQLNETEADILITTGNFKGQISCCKCSEAGCSSEYLWAANDFGLISFHTVAAAVTKINLYPFKLV